MKKSKDIAPRRQPTEALVTLMMMTANQMKMPMRSSPTMTDLMMLIPKAFHSCVPYVMENSIVLYKLFATTISVKNVL
jgi:hypothetical protein